MIEESQRSTAHRPDHRINKQKPADRYKTLRQWLNIIFMIGAIVGVIFYLTSGNQNTGIIIILASMVFKFVEAALRMIR